MLSARAILLPILLLIFPLLGHAQVEQSLSLTFPPPDRDGSQLTFVAGNKIRIQWTTTFDLINVQVWQGPDEIGTNAFLNLLSVSKPYTFMRVLDE